MTANAVCPGWVRTAMMERAVERITATTDRDEQQAEAALVEQMPIGRALEPGGRRGRLVPRLPGGGGDQRAERWCSDEPVPRVRRDHGDWKNFDFALDDGVATVTFSRPDKLNALTFDVYADLRDLLAELPHRGDVRVLVLTGEGRGFCSGGDVEEIIGELQGMEAAQLLEFTRMSGAVVKAMRDAPIPIIAAVNGVAAGAGAVLALAADFRLVAEAAKFSFLFTAWAWPAPTWAPRTCSRGSSVSDGQRSS